MFDKILYNLLNQKEVYLELKTQVSRRPLEKSIDYIIKQINKDLNKISNLNKNFGCEFKYETNI